MGAQTASSDIDTELWTLKIEMTPVITFICNFWDPAAKALPSSYFYFKTVVFFFCSLSSSKELTLFGDEARIEGGDSQKLSFKFTQGVLLCHGR